MLDYFYRAQGQKTVFYAIGRLEDGRTFGFSDDRLEWGLYILASHASKVRSVVGPQVAIRRSACVTMDNRPLIWLNSLNHLHKAGLNRRLLAAGIPTYGGDLDPLLCYLAARQIKQAVTLSGPCRASDQLDLAFDNPAIAPADKIPGLSLLCLDIETSPQADVVLGVSLVFTFNQDYSEEFHILDPGRRVTQKGVHNHPREEDLLRALARRVRDLDPDIISGWNVIDFDLAVLAKRFAAHGLAFNLGRSRQPSQYRASRYWGGSRAEVSGRQVVDAMHLVRQSHLHFTDYSLDNVARKLLGRGKTLHAQAGQNQAEVIRHTYEREPQHFVAYGLEDSRLVMDILNQCKLIELAVARARLIGLPITRCGSSTAAFESLYVRALKRRGIAAPSKGVDVQGARHVTGGLVMPPQAGLYRNILVFDFKSLYPTIIRTFNIDPLALLRAGQDAIPAPNGVRLGREPGILPGMIATFFAQREAA